MKDCSVAGCPDMAHARGMCNLHYMRFRRYGDPLVKLRQRGRLDAPNQRKGAVAVPVAPPAVHQGTVAERALRDRVRAVLDAAEPFDIGPGVMD